MMQGSGRQGHQVDVVVHHFLLGGDQKRSLVGVVVDQNLKIQVHVADVEGDVLLASNGWSLQLLFGHRLTLIS
jgi:hypothetical protein